MTATQHQKFDEYSTHIAVGLFLFALVPRVAWWLHKGTIITPDTSDYTGVCELWRTAPLTAIGSHVGIEYAGFSIPFCSVLGLTGNTYAAWIIVQIVLSAAACVLVYDIGKRLINHTGGLVAGFTLAVLFDSFRYITHMLSETTFIFALTLALWALSRYHVTPSRKNRMLVWAALGWVAITRPFGAPIVMLWLATDLLPSENAARLDLLKNRTAIGGLFAGIVGMVYVSSRTRWMNRALGKVWTNGQVFSPNRPPIPLPDLSFTPVPASNLAEFAVYNADHLIALAFVKMAVFFTPARLPHIPENTTQTVSLLIYVPVLLLSFYGAGKLALRRSPLFVYWVFPIFAILLIVAVTFVTPSFRYRVPAGPSFALLTGYAIASTIQIEDLLAKL